MTSSTAASGRVYVYALLGYAVETTDPAAVARFGRAQAAEAQVLAAVSFVEPEVLALGTERLAEWAATEPALAVYGHYLDDLGRRAGHTRSAEVEEVLGLVSDVFSGPFGVYSALVDSDVVFEPALSEAGEPARGHAGLDRRAPRERRPHDCGVPPGRAMPTATSECETRSRRTSPAPSSRPSSRRASAATSRRSPPRSRARTCRRRCSTT